MPQIFRKAPPRPKNIIQPYRGSKAERGYGGRWETFSEKFRKRHPFCAFCLQDDRTTLITFGRTGVVDHKIPLVDGGPDYEAWNVHGLCNGHHGGLKRLLEEHARATGQIDKLPLWCDDPSARPRMPGDVS